MGFCRWEHWSGLPFPLPGNRPRDWTCISCIGRQILYQLATREAIHISLYAKTLCKKNVFGNRKTNCDIPFSWQGNCQIAIFSKCGYVQDAYWKIPYIVYEFLRMYQHLLFPLIWKKPDPHSLNLQRIGGKKIIIYHLYFGFSWGHSRL